MKSLLLLWHPIDPSANKWARQAALPIKRGDLGLGDLVLTAPAACLDCWFQVAPLISTRFPLPGSSELAVAVQDTSFHPLHPGMDDPAAVPLLPPFQASLQAAYHLLAPA